MATTFTGQPTVPPTPIGGGVRATVFSGSFSGTVATYTFVANVCNIVSLDVNGTPMNITGGTTLDRIIVNNSFNASGILTSLSSTNGFPEPLITLTRTGTNGQDFNVVILSKG